MMILLLGGSGYVGTAFRELFERKGIPHLVVPRVDWDGNDPAALEKLIRLTKADFLVNAAGYTGKPNVDACEFQRAECIYGNAVLPGRVAIACTNADIPWGHVSSGCIFSGRRPDGGGFTESDEPNFSFRTGPCSFYSGTKALGEEILLGLPNCYVWRLRIPFNNLDSARNYLTKLCTYPRLLDAENSLSHLGDFVSGCLQCWEKQSPYGIYNLTNPGSVTTREVVALIKNHRRIDKVFQFFDNEEEFMSRAAIAPRSNCVLDTEKANCAGITMRPVMDALVESLQNWKFHCKANRKK